MTITLGAINTGTHLHGSIKSEVWDVDRQRESFFGVEGEFYLLGAGKGRELSTWLLLYGFSTHALCHTGIDALNALINVNGTMTWTVGADVKTFTNTIFTGFVPDEDPWLDGSGINGWQVKGTMKFRQVFS